MPRPTLRLLPAAAAVLLLLPACGSDDGGTTPEGAAPSGGTTAAAGWEPVTIESALGPAVLEEAPERVVTWGWGTTDAAIALGVVPVAIPSQSYGGDEEGVLPWVRTALEEAGAEVPTLLTEGEEPPYEEILAADPDVILAQYSGLTQEQFDRLEAIAPVVAYPDQPWSTPWRDVVTTAGEALGREAEAEAVLADIDEQMSAAAAEHPEFEGSTIAAVYDLDAFYVYLPADPRVGFLEDLGFETAPSVTELDTGESTFFFTLSPERTDELTADVLLNYANDDAAQDTFLAKPSTQALPQYAGDGIALVTGESLVSSVSPPTALSATYGLDEIVETLAAAVAGEGYGAGATTVS